MYSINYLKQIARTLPLWALLLASTCLFSSCVDDGDTHPMGEKAHEQTGEDDETREEDEDGTDATDHYTHTGYAEGTITSTDNLEDSIQETFRYEYAENTLLHTEADSTGEYSQYFKQYGAQNPDNNNISISLKLEKEADNTFSVTGATCHFVFNKNLSDSMLYISLHANQLDHNITINNYIYDLNTGIVTFDFVLTGETTLDTITHSITVTGSYNSETNVYLSEI